MASGTGKENIADGLVAGLSFSKAPQLSPRKSSRKTRSKSIGPGGLDALEETALKESSGNRRKSAFIPAVKSILSSNDEDEKKRRRKSLARRRVSFAPEATLHTWDVVEYVRDATTSSASSDAARPESSTSEPISHTSPSPRFADGDASGERLSTPPQSVEEIEGDLGSSPANQRDLHQKKHRRSSGIPPMNFNNPDDVYSSSPLSGDNSSPIAGDNTTALSDEDEDIGKIDSSLDSNETSESSSRLDAALRQATTHAGTQQLHLDPSGGGNDGDVSMDIAEDEITTSFKPSATKGDLAIEGHQVNKDPFAGILPSTAHEESDGEDMSMDITRAIGSIVQQAESQSSDVEDMSMDLTVPLGSIKSTNTQEQTSRRKSLKRRASLFEASQGSPAKRSASRRTSIRQRTAATDESSAQDATMDFTVAIGTIKNASMAKKQRSPLRRNSVDTSFGEETMDFTVAIGGIKNAQTSAGQQANVNSSDDEDMSMEFTKVVGGIKNLSKQATTPPKPRTDHTDNLTDIKVASPKRSPRRSRLSEAKGTQASLSPQKSHSLTPKTTPDRTPRSSTGTPVIPPPSEQIEMFEPSPFVRRAPATLAPHSESLATPTRASPQIPQSNIPYDPIAAPILNRRRSSLSSVQFSPLCPAKEEPILKSSALLSNIRLLSTPRKQTLMSPSKRGLTPKNLQTHLTAATPRRQTPTPRRLMSRESVSPMKRVAFGNESASENAENKDEVRTQAEEDPQDDEVDRISLQEFLDMTKIRFMDLSTTKRRHTAAPSSFHDKEVEEKEESLDRYVVAAACTLPEYELYQHACHEMKKYISDGRHFVRTMEANVLEENPVLFTEYLTAPPDQRIVMDNQFKNLKTSARLDARGEWYGWRSTLLHDLRSGLLSTMEGFLRDESVLKEQEEQLDAILPQLIQRHEQLGAQCQQLQQRHDELNSCDREELEQIRERLVAADSGLAEKRQLLAQLKEELSSKEARLEAVKERKIECAAEIKAAERVREECRGWSTKEVTDLKERVAALERAHGWSITTASSMTVTMTHLNDLELYFQPSAFATGEEKPNASISLTYVGDSATPHPRPLTTSKRFFLQLIRAHLHCLPQSQTRIPELVALVKNGWATALAVAEGVRWLEHNFITEEYILSDERMAISANMLLPTLQTKIKCAFEISISLSPNGVETHVEPSAELIYGEKYKVEKMTHFLKDFCGEKVKAEKDMGIWAEGVLDLAQRLKATGRKGERA